jgi:hypothetical protein
LNNQEELECHHHASPFISGIGRKFYNKFIHWRFTCLFGTLHIYERNT